MMNTLVLLLAQQYAKRIVQLSEQDSECSRHVDAVAAGREGVYEISNLIIVLVPEGEPEPDIVPPEDNPVCRLIQRMIALSLEDPECQDIAELLVERGCREVSLPNIILCNRKSENSSLSRTQQGFVETMRRLGFPDSEQA